MVWAGDIEDGHVGMGDDAGTVRAGGKQECLAEADVGVAGFSFDVCVAVECDEDVKAIVAGN